MDSLHSLKEDSARKLKIGNSFPESNTHPRYFFNETSPPKHSPGHPKLSATFCCFKRTGQNFVFLD